MVLLSNTILHYNNTQVTYEIMRSGAMLMFKPFFYNPEENFPFIVLVRSNSGWKFQDDFDNCLKEQVIDDINSLKIN